MKRQYVCVQGSTITKETLDAVKLGDLIRVNEWTVPMRVVGVTANYFLMVRKLFGRTRYSVCEKVPWNGGNRNAMRSGAFHCGDDNWIGGASMGFPSDLNNQGEVNAYLEEFERGITELSVRRAIAIDILHVKSA